MQHSATYPTKTRPHAYCTLSDAARKRTALRLPNPTKFATVTGFVSPPPKPDGRFRIARYPKIGVQTIPSENYGDPIIQSKREGTPSKLCLGSTPRAKGESIVRILGASQRTSQTYPGPHLTALTHRNLTLDAPGRATAIHFFNPSGGSSD